MKFTGRDFAKIRFPLLGTLLLSAAGGLIAWWSADEANVVRRERDAAAAHSSQLEQRLRQARTEEQEIKARTQTFQQWQSAGIAGEEKRLEWTEALRNIQHDLRLPGMSYEFGAQTPLENVGGVAYIWFASPLRLQLRLLHEEDLLRTLSAIEREVPALVLARSCKLARSAGDETAATGVQLAAECQMQWLTTRRASGK
jgi:hypothetical protein